jgi:pantoate kinase
LEYRVAESFSPAGISSFFEICDRTKNGEPINKSEKIGARGGGFGLQKGIHTKIVGSKAKKNNILIYINDELATKAKTTKTAANLFLKKTEKKFNISIKHKIEIPIGSGFGTSAGGALTTGLALSKILDLNLTYNQIGKIAHEAEIKCKTGLGTVGPLMVGGCVLTIEPGAPGISVIDQIPITKDYVIVSGVVNPISTNIILNSEKKRKTINKWGKATLNQILANPTPKNFMNCSLEFAEKTGFLTPKIKKLVKYAKKAGAIGSAQNMVGEAIHTLTLQKNATKIVKVFEKILPKEKIFISRIDFQGARVQ